MEGLRPVAFRVDIRTIQLMLGHADIKQKQRYLTRERVHPQTQAFLNVGDRVFRTRRFTGMYQR